MCLTGRLILAFVVGAGFGVSFWNVIPHFLLWDKEVDKIPTDPLDTHNESEEFHKSDNSVAKQLAEKIRVLCMVLIRPANHHKAPHLNATWGKRCTVLLFMSTKENTTIPTIALPVEEAAEWGLTKASFRYVYEKYLDSVDWVLTTNDRSYVIMENLRYLLSNHSAEEALFLGRLMWNLKSQVYFMDGKSGYVLSKEAVRRLVEDGLGNEQSKCKKDDKGSADQELGKCLASVGVEAVDTRDSLRRGRFFPSSVLDQITKFVQEPTFFEKLLNKDLSYYKEGEGFECCSDLSITFGSLTTEDKYVMEYFVYHLRPYGITHNATMPILKPPSTNTSSRSWIRTGNWSVTNPLE